MEQLEEDYADGPPDPPTQWWVKDFVYPTFAGIFIVLFAAFAFYCAICSIP